MTSSNFTIMKKITSLILIAFFGLVVSASAAIVTLTNSSSYEVSIDSRVYTGNNSYTITDLAQGNHVISVYQVTSNGVFGIGKKTNLISSREFTLTNSDVRINVNQNGQLNVSQKNNNQNGSGNNDGTWDNNDKKYGKSEGKGNGHKYGHYKNRKAKKNHDNRNNDDRRENDRKYDNKQQNNNQQQNKKSGNRNN